MKCLKEPLSRLTNHRATSGALLDERFGNIAVLDEELLLATCVYLI